MDFILNVFNRVHVTIDVKKLFILHYDHHEPLGFLAGPRAKSESLYSATNSLMFRKPLKLTTSISASKL